MKKNRLYNISIPLIGLTGGIATGKSTVTSIFRKEGLSVICADELVKRIYQKQESLEFIKNHFPFAFDLESNSIIFSTLRKWAFSAPENKKFLEDFIYAQLKDEFLKEYKNFRDSDFLIYDVPLLFEKKLEDFFDYIICVSCDEKVQKDRLLKRDKMIDIELMKSILSSQGDLKEKEKKSDFVIKNDESLKFLEEKCLDVISLLKNHFH